MIYTNTKSWTNGGLMLGHRLRCWLNIKPLLVKHFVYAGEPGDRVLHLRAGGPRVVVSTAA